MEAGKHQMSMQEYLALDALSSGLCHTLLSQSPGHALYAKHHPTEPTTAMDIGTAVHKILLEGNEDGIVIVEAENWRTKVARESRQDGHHNGKVPILASALAEIREMVDVARAYVAGSEMAGVLNPESGKPEQTLLWQETNVWCKARPDWLTDDRRALLHFKTTAGSANPEAMAFRFLDMGYDVAAAFYERAIAEVFGIRNAIALRSVFLVQETDAPYACSLISLAPSMREIATVKVEYAIRTWTECLGNGKWPLYSPRIAYAEARSWQITQAAEKALGWGDQDGYERIIEMVGGTL